MPLDSQLIWLFVLAIPVACISWTVTHEEVFREPREFCEQKSKTGNSPFIRKFFYVFTCEYCFSHYIVIIALFITRFTLLMNDWRGYVVAGFSLVWIANIYMSLFARVRTGLKREKTIIKNEEKKLQEKQPVKERSSYLG